MLTDKVLMVCIWWVRFMDGQLRCSLLPVSSSEWGSRLGELSFSHWVFFRPVLSLAVYEKHVVRSFSNILAQGPIPDPWVTLPWNRSGHLFLKTSQVIHGAASLVPLLGRCSRGRDALTVPPLPLMNHCYPLSLSPWEPVKKYIPGPQFFTE